MNYDEGWVKYIERLTAVNDETRTQKEHDSLVIEFRGWQQGFVDAGGWPYNGDHHYIPLVDAGKMQVRPMCCGEFLDWKHTGE